MNFGALICSTAATVETVVHLLDTEIQFPTFKLFLAQFCVGVAKYLAKLRPSGLAVLQAVFLWFILISPLKVVDNCVSSQTNLLTEETVPVWSTNLLVLQPTLCSCQSQRGFV